MVNFNIELYETKSVDRKFLSMDTMLKFNHQKINQLWRVLLLIDLETFCFLYNCAYMIDANDNLSENMQFIKTKACGLSEHMACQNT